MAGNDIGPRIGIDGEKQFRDSLSAINAQMRALGNEMKAVTAEFSENAKSEEALAARTDVLTRSVDAAKSKLSILDGQLDRQRGRLSELARELERAAAEYGETSQEAAAAQNAYNRQYRIVANLEGQYQRTRRQLAEFEQQMRDAGDTAEEANGQLGGAGVLAGQAAWDGIKTAVRAVTSELQKAISVGMQFDAAVSDIAATMGTTVSSIGNLRGFAQEMGATTVFTATQAAQALNYMALAGYDAETAMSTLPNVLNLAAAGGVELATASDMVTDAQSALGLSLEQTGVLVDEMAKTSTKTNTSVAQLGEAILTVGGTAKFLAGGTAELNQVLGLLADNSIKGAEGGTNIDQYRKVSETIYKADEKALQEREKLWQTAGDNIVKLEEKFQKELSDRAQEIVNSYKLFDEVPEYQKASGQELISNLENQIGAIQSFYDNVAALEERGVDAALADDIRKMGVKASGELAGLLALTDEQLTRYSELYGEKQALANDIAAKELGELRLQTNEEIIGQLDDVAQLYDTNAPALGMAFAENLAAGMFEGMPAVEAMAQTVARAAMSSFEQSFNRDVEAMMTASGSRVSAGDIGELMAGFANSVRGTDIAAAPQPVNIVLQTLDGLTIAKAFLPDFRKADRENPDKLGD